MHDHPIIHVVVIHRALGSNPRQVCLQKQVDRRASRKVDPPEEFVNWNVGIGVCILLDSLAGRELARDRYHVRQSLHRADPHDDEPAYRTREMPCDVEVPESPNLERRSLWLAAQEGTPQQNRSAFFIAGAVPLGEVLSRYAQATGR
jgi:hypothetical protein